MINKKRFKASKYFATCCKLISVIQPTAFNAKYNCLEKKFTNIGVMELD